MNTSKNYSNLQVGNKVETLDKYGYCIMSLCGHISQIFADGSAIIKSFDGLFYSSISHSFQIGEVSAV